MFSKILDKLTKEKEPLKIEIDEATDCFKEEKAEEISEAEEEFEDRRAEIQQIIEDLKKELEEIEAYEDHKERQVIDDVMENIGSRRRELISDTELPEDPEKLRETMENFMESFHGVSRKERAVMEEANIPEGFKRTVGDLENAIEELEEFMESDYQTLSDYKEIKQKIEDREQIRAKINRMKQEIEDLDPEELQERKEEKTQELEELKESDEWTELEEMKEALRQKKKQRKSERKLVGEKLGKMERGMKKVLYRIENDGLDIDIDQKIAEKMKERDKDGIIDEKPEKVENTARKIGENLPENLLDEKQEEKFLDGLKRFKDFKKHKQKLEKVNNEIEEIESDINNAEVLERKNSIESEIDRIEKQYENSLERKETLEQKIEDKEKQREQNREDVKLIMERSLERPVRLVEQD